MGHDRLNTIEKGSEFVRPMSETPHLDYLRVQVNALKQLLDDPHPGLAVWHQMYGKRMDGIAKFWNGNATIDCEMFEALIECSMRLDTAIKKCPETSDGRALARVYEFTRNRAHKALAKVGGEK